MTEDGKIRLHAIERETPAKQGLGTFPAPAMARGNRPRVLLGGIMAVVLGTLAFVSLSGREIYHVESEIRVVCQEQQDVETVLAAHLLALQSRRPGWFSRGEKAAWARTADNCSLACRARFDPPAIILSASGEVNYARQLAQVQQAYLADFQMYKKARFEGTGSQLKALADQRLQVQAQLDQLHQQVRQLLDQFGGTELMASMETAIKDLRELQGQTQQYKQQIAQTTDQLAQVREELANPTVQIDPEALRAACMADKLFHSDFNALQRRHRIYLTNLETQIAGCARNLSRLRDSLQKVSAAIGKQLSLDLAEDLADDLLQLNLTCKLFLRQLAGFQQRWQAYSAELAERFEDPLEADIDAVQSALGQLRAQFEEKCGQLDQQLRQLQGKLIQQSGQRGPGSLASLTVRSVATSAITPELELGLRRFERLMFYLKRATGENNVELTTVGRVVRAVQARLLARKKKIHQRVYQQAVELARHRAEAKLVQLQQRYQQLLAGLMDQTDKVIASQQRALKLFNAYPEFRKAQDQIETTQQQLAQIDRQLRKIASRENLPLEMLQPMPVQVRRQNQAPVPMAVRVALAIMAGAGGLTLGLFGSKLIAPG